MLSPYEFWQFWRNTTDADVGRFLKLYTDLPVEECERLGALAGSEINGAKIVLANEITRLLHGDVAAQAAEATARDVFEDGGIGAAMTIVTVSVDQVTASMTNGTGGMSAAQLFAYSKLVSSNKEAKRLIAEGGARINGELVLSPVQTFGPNELAQGVKLTAGKKRHCLVKMVANPF